MEFIRKLVQEVIQEGSRASFTKVAEFPDIGGITVMHERRGDKGFIDEWIFRNKHGIIIGTIIKYTTLAGQIEQYSLSFIKRNGETKEDEKTDFWKGKDTPDLKNIARFLYLYGWVK